MTAYSLFCAREWNGATPAGDRCSRCGVQWWRHRRTGLAKTLGGCGATGHWTAGGPPWGVEGRTYWCGACETEKGLPPIAALILPDECPECLAGLEPDDPPHWPGCVAELRRDRDDRCPACGLTVGLHATGCHERDEAIP